VVISTDVAVLGGGPAGSATACALAAAGREVFLIERAAGPRHKVCGEFLSVETLASLTRLGIDPGVLGAVPIDRLSVWSPAGGGGATLPFRALSLSRFRLDQAILDRAAILGVGVRQGVSVRSAEPLKTGWQLRCGGGETIRCRILVLATGKRAPRRMMDGRDGSMVGLKMHLKLPAEITRTLLGQVELFFLERGYAGLAVIEDGLANLCLLLPASVVAGIGPGWATLRDFLTSSLPSLARRLDGAAALWDKPHAIVCPAGGYFRSGLPGPENPLYPVGDRLAHIPPFTGDGLAIALYSAAAAAEHICRGGSPAAYLTEVRRQTAPTLRVASAVSWLAANRVGSVMLTSIARRAPGLLQTIARRTRLPSGGTDRDQRSEDRPFGLCDSSREGAFRLRMKKSADF
jgi:flavin-dependent dehydrogenase